MKAIAQWLGCGLAAIAALACLAAWQGGAPRMEPARHDIIVGKTTKADLDLAFGPATSVSLDSGYEVWIYRHKEETGGFARHLPLLGNSALFAPHRKREVVVLFQPNGVVKKYRVHESQS
ncbi:hypothetical protein AAKU55_003358 [Oxalobacteraceae bacterium GrIS 1.11]